RRSSRPSSALRRSIERASLPSWQPEIVAKPWWLTWWAWLGTAAAVLLMLLAIRPVRDRLRSPFTAAPQEMHVAVLPFTNLGDEPENQALADGLMESLTGELSNLKIGDKS